MLEIIALIVLGKKIAEMARRRGRSPTPWVILFVFSWIAGEFAGAIISIIVMLAADPNMDEPNLLMVLPGAFLGAACGAVFAFLVVSLLPPVESYDEDDYEPRRGEYYDEENESDSPRRKGHYEASDDYERPRKKRRYDDEDEYDDRRR